jgi:hypothetical protein
MRYGNIGDRIFNINECTLKTFVLESSPTNISVSENSPDSNILLYSLDNKFHNNSDVIFLNKKKKKGF